MFELTTPTPAILKSITPRQEHHGEDIVVAISMRLEITAANTLLDLLSPKLRHALYESVAGQEDLPGVEASTPLLRFNAFEQHALKACYEGWSLHVDHGIEEHNPITLGSSKVDVFRVVAMEGGTVKLSFRVGSNDLSAEEIGLLCGKLGSEISITLHAPEKPVDAIDGTTAAFEADHPSAEDLFADGNQPPDEEEESGGGATDAAEPEPEPVSRTRSPVGSRTARGREKTKAALAEGSQL